MTHTLAELIESIEIVKTETNFSVAEKLIDHDKDVPILATVLKYQPDYIVTGDTHFFNQKISEKIHVIRTREFLETILE